jgi:hypothetical protein
MTWLWFVLAWLALAAIFAPFIMAAIHVPPEISGDDNWP